MTDEECEFCGIAENCPNYKKGFKEGQKNAIEEMSKSLEDLKMEFSVIEALKEQVGK